VDRVGGTDLGGVYGAFTWKVQGLADVLNNIQDVGRRADDAADRAEDALKDTGKEARNLGQALEKTGDQGSRGLGSIGKAASGIKGVLGGIIGVAGGMLAARGVQSLVSGVREMVTASTGLPQVAQAFDALGGSIERMRAGTMNMVTDAELMRQFNQAAQLVGQDFAQTLPNAMQHLAKVSASTGQSMDFLVNSLITGVGRLSPMILDNLAIQVDLTAAYEDYARELGKSADALTKSEQQTALMNQVMRLLKDNTADMPTVLGSVEQKVRAVETAFANMKDQIGANLLPVLEAMLPHIQTIVDALAEWLADPAIREGIVEFAANLGKLLEWLVKITPGLAATNQEVGKFKALFSEIGAQQTGLQWGRQLAESLFGVKSSAEEAQTSVAEAGEATNQLAVRGSLSADQLKRAFTEAEAEATRFGQQAPQGMAAFRQSLDEMAAKAAEFGAEMASAYQNAFSELESIRTSHQDAMANLQEDYLQSQADAELQYQMDSIQARADYEAEAAALAQAGKEQELATLTSKFEASRSNASAAYQQQQRMAQLNYAKQQIAQQQAYIQQLKQQRQKTLLSIAETALQYNAQGKLTDAGLEAILGALTEGQGLQLQQQINHAANMQTVSGQLSEGLVSDAITTVNAINAAYDQDLAKAEEALAGYQTDFESIRDEILASIQAEYTADDFGGFETAATDAATSAQSATKSLTDVAKDIDAGVQAAQSAFEGIVDWIGREMPENLAQGFDKMGSFVKQSAKAVYDWLEDPEFNLKDKLDAVKEYLSPMAELLRFASTDIGELATVEEMPDLTTWQDQVRALFEAAFLVVQDIRDTWGTVPEGETESELQKVAGVVGYVKNILGIIGTDLSKVAPAEGNFAANAESYIDQLRILGSSIFNWLRQIPEGLHQALQTASEIAPMVKELFSLIGLDLEKVVPVEFAFPAKAMAYVRQLRFLGGQLYNWIKEIPENLHDSVEAAGQVADDVKKLFGLVGPDLGKLVPVQFNFVPKALAYVRQLRFLGGQLYNWIQEIPDDTRKALEAAADVAGDIKSLFEVLGVDLTQVLELPNIGVFSTRLKQFLATMRLAVPDLKEFISDVQTQFIEATEQGTRDLLPAAAESMENLASVFSIFDVGKTLTEISRMGGLRGGRQVGQDIVSQLNEAMDPMMNGYGEYKSLPELAEEMAGKTEQLEGWAPRAAGIVEALKGWFTNLQGLRQVQMALGSATAIAGYMADAVVAFNLSAQQLSGLRLPEIPTATGNQAAGALPPAEGAVAGVGGALLQISVPVTFGDVTAGDPQELVDIVSQQLGDTLSRELGDRMAQIAAMLRDAAVPAAATGGATP